VRGVIVQGWLSYPHSYALINRCQCREMLRRPNLKVFHQELAPYRAEWGHAERLPGDARDDALSQIPQPRVGEPAEVTLRVAFPYNLKRSSTPRTVVFATAEHGFVPAHYVLGARRVDESVRQSGVLIVTPSDWSR
jgi:hypothetical protein